MPSFTIFLAIAAFLAGTVIGALAVIVIGIRNENRAKTLTDTPRTHPEAATRRVLGVGARAGNAPSGGHGKE